MTRRNLALCAVALLAAIGSIWAASASADADAEEGNLVYELRTYTTDAGKLPALHARFRDHTMGLFEKHGMKNVIYWTPADKENTLVYVIAHKSEEAAKKSWAGFIGDPEWQAVYKESRKDGPLVVKVEKVFLNPTDYSPMK